MISAVCVDASLILRMLVPGPMSDWALAILDEWERRDVLLTAPTLLGYEVTSSLRRLVHLGEITASEGEEAFKRFRAMGVRLSYRPGVLALSWRLAKRFDRPPAYDTAYLAHAELRKSELWTADEKLYNAVRRDLRWVRWLGEYHAPAGEGTRH